MKIREAKYLDRLKPEQQRIYEEVARYRKQGVTIVAACEKLGIKRGLYMHIEAIAVYGGSYGTKAYHAAVRKPTKTVKGSATKPPSYAAIPLAPASPRAQELVIPLSSDPKGPVVMIFGTQAQLATLLREAMTK